MNCSNNFEDYFVRIYKNYGISRLNFRDNKIYIDEQNLRETLFSSDDFNEEFENLFETCQTIYREINSGFSIKIKKDINNEFCVLVA